MRREPGWWRRMSKNRGDATRVTSQRRVLGKAEYDALNTAPWAYMPDMGCHINPVRFGCLTCPLAQCIYDSREEWQRQKVESIEERDKRIRYDRAVKHLTVPQLAQRYGMCERVIQRALAKGRKPTEAGAV